LISISMSFKNFSSCF